MSGYNFTERVRKVLAMAREESARLHHEYVGTEHLLLGLVREGGGVAGAALDGLKVDRDAIARRVNEVVKRGRAATTQGPDLPYTSRAKVVLEQAMSEARELNHSYIGTEHLLLGLLREGKGIAAQILGEAGVTLGEARSEVVRLLGEGPAVPVTQAGSSAASLFRAPAEHVEQVEVIVRYRDGRRIQGSFNNPYEAIGFLRSTDRPNSP
jgi:ATP-dependent Clp protease ATP-binding subunit ClpC